MEKIEELEAILIEAEKKELGDEKCPEWMIDVKRVSSDVVISSEYTHAGLKLVSANHCRITGDDYCPLIEGEVETHEACPHYRKPLPSVPHRIQRKGRYFT